MENILLPKAKLITECKKKKINVKTKNDKNKKVDKNKATLQYELLWVDSLLSAPGCSQGNAARSSAVACVRPSHSLPLPFL